MVDTQSKKDAELSERVRIIFEESFTVALPHLKKLEKMQAAYECELPDEWGTYSQIYLPHFRTAVEQALPDVVNYLMPKGGMLSIRPQEEMSYEQVATVEDYYDQLIRHKIGLKKNGLLTLKDCMKLNIGYGKVTTEIITPINAVANTIFGGGEVRNIKRMELGAPREVIKYQYVDWRSVIPMPGGGTPEDVPGIFHLEGIREDVFLNMYRIDKESENPSLMGDPNTIIKSVREGKTAMNHFPIEWVLSQFGTTSNTVKDMRKLNDINRRMMKNAKSPVQIPVLKCEFNREHIWMTPCGTVIYHIEDSVQTLRNSIVKATACPDGNNWYPLGDAGSSFDATEGANVLQNALMDMLSYKLNPTTVINRSIITKEGAIVEPYATLDAYGKAGDAVAVIQGAQIDQSMFNIGGQLDQHIATANGQPANLQGSGTAGVMRGGGQAFESFLQSTRARSKLAGAVLQTGWLDDVVNNVVLLSQIIGKEDSYIFEDGLNKSFVEKTITAQDIRHSFSAVVDLDDKFNKSASERSMDLTVYREVLKDNPKIDQTAALEEAIGNREKFRRLKASKEVEQQQLQAMQEQAAAAEKAKADAQGGGQGQGPGMDQGAQALDGQKSQRAMG